MFLRVSSFAIVATALSAAAALSAEPLKLVVMDPLAIELSCPCVQGYAQRDYHKLAAYLGEQLGRPVEVSFSESLVKATKEQTEGKADIVIGKHSVVEFDARRLGIQFEQVASLTDKDGKTTQTGLIVVRTGDAAKSVADLKGYRLIFGPAECDEKNAAALALLKAHGIVPAEPLETVAGCEEGATTILELPPEQHGAAVISSYAHPLLEGCGTVPKGAIRVVGETQPVPFVAAFVDAKLPDDVRRSVAAALLAVGDDPLLMIALETKRGFVAVDSARAEIDPPAKKK